MTADPSSKMGETTAALALADNKDKDRRKSVPGLLGGFARFQNGKAGPNGDSAAGAGAVDPNRRKTIGEALVRPATSASAAAKAPPAGGGEAQQQQLAAPPPPSTQKKKERRKEGAESPAVPASPLPLANKTPGKPTVHVGKAHQSYYFGANTSSSIKKGVDAKRKLNSSSSAAAAANDFTLDSVGIAGSGYDGSINAMESSFLSSDSSSADTSASSTEDLLNRTSSSDTTELTASIFVQMKPTPRLHSLQQQQQRRHSASSVNKSLPGADPPPVAAPSPREENRPAANNPGSATAAEEGSRPKQGEGDARRLPFGTVPMNGGRGRNSLPPPATRSLLAAPPPQQQTQIAAARSGQRQPSTNARRESWHGSSAAAALNSGNNVDHEMTPQFHEYANKLKLYRMERERSRQAELQRQLAGSGGIRSEPSAADNSGAATPSPAPPEIERRSSTGLEMLRGEDDTATSTFSAIVRAGHQPVVDATTGASSTRLSGMLLSPIGKSASEGRRSSVGAKSADASSGELDVSLGSLFEDMVTADVGGGGEESDSSSVKVGPDSTVAKAESVKTQSSALTSKAVAGSATHNPSPASRTSTISTATGISKAADATEALGDTASARPLPDSIAFELLNAETTSPFRCNQRSEERKITKSLTPTKLKASPRRLVDSPAGNTRSAEKKRRKQQEELVAETLFSNSPADPVDEANNNQACDTPLGGISSEAASGKRKCDTEAPTDDDESQKQESVVAHAQKRRKSSVSTCTSLRPILRTSGSSTTKDLSSKKTVAFGSPEEQNFNSLSPPMSVTPAAKSQRRDLEDVTVEMEPDMTTLLGDVGMSESEAQHVEQSDIQNAASTPYVAKPMQQVVEPPLTRLSVTGESLSVDAPPDSAGQNVSHRPLEALPSADSSRMSVDSQSENEGETLDADLTEEMEGDMDMFLQNEQDAATPKKKVDPSLDSSEAAKSSSVASARLHLDEEDETVDFDMDMSNYLEGGFLSASRRQSRSRRSSISSSRFSLAPHSRLSLLNRDDPDIPDGSGLDHSE